MKYVLFLSIVAIVLFAAPRLAAQEMSGIEPIPPGVDRIVPLKLNVPAPFAGQLFDNDTALRWANWLKQYKLRLRVDVEEQKKLCLIDTNALRQELVVERDKHRLVVKDYETRIAQMELDTEPPPWYRSVWVGMAIGAGAAMLSVTVVLYSTH